MTEEFQGSPTADRIQTLLGERLGASKKRQKEIDKEVAQLKSTNEGKRDAQEQKDAVVKSMKRP